MARDRSSLRSSRFDRLLVGLAFGAALLLAAPSMASAERVVLYPVAGSASASQRSDIEDAIAASLGRVGHTRVPAPGGLSAARPGTSAELDGVALATSARYVVVPDAELMPGQYRLHLVVGREGSVEELTVNVLRTGEAARLDDVLRAMLRPEGIGEDALRLSGDETPEERAAREAREREAADASASADAEAAARAAAEREAEEAAARAAAEQAAAEREAEEAARAAEAREREAEEAAAREAAAWEARPQLGSDGPGIVMVGVLGGLLAPMGASGPASPTGMPQPPSGPLGIAMIQARGGYALEGTGGLELRGGLDVLVGGTAGLGILVGASYQLTPFVAPIHLGAVVELGVNVLFSGPKDAGFVGRVSAILSWMPVEHFSIEVALPELGYLSNGPGALTLGVSARAGYRF